MGLIYRISSSIDENFARKFTNIFLCVNTLDGIFFPLSYSLSNGIYSNFFNSNRYSTKDSLESLSDEQDDEYNNDNNLNDSVSTSEKNFAMVDINDNNNFDISYI